MSTSSTGSSRPPRDDDHTQPVPRAPLERDRDRGAGGAPGDPEEGSGRWEADEPEDTPTRSFSYGEVQQPEYAGERAPRYAGERAPRYAEEPAYQGEAEDRGRSTLPREEDFYSGVKIGSAFYGWLTATAMLVLISTVLSGIGASIAVATRTTTDQLTSSLQSDPQTAAIVGGVAFALVVFLSYYCGGYVAGRMARFDGARQGVAVWCWALLMTLLMWLAVFLVGDRWDPLASVEGLSTLDVPVSPTTTTGLIVVGAAALVALLAAILGASVGVRYHRRIDDAMMSA